MKNQQIRIFNPFPRFFHLWILCIVLLFSSSSFALDPQGPLSLSMGGAGRAVQKGAEYHLLNPASLVHSQAFDAAGFYIFETKENKPYWGVSLMENRQIPLAISYIKERKSEVQYFSISTAAFILPGWSLGLSLSRWETSQDTNWNIQTGFFIKPKQSSFSIGATWDHILPVEGAFKGQRNWGLGLAYELYKWLHLRADILYNQKKQWTIVGGAETTINGILVLRFGSRWHLTSHTSVFSGGIGLKTKQISIDYSLSQTEHTKQWLHAFNVRSHF